MDRVPRRIIHAISRHSNLSHDRVRMLLSQYVYADRRDWENFFRVFVISLGVGFMVSGVVFFFAYNWSALHKFMKLGLVGGLLISATIATLFLGNRLIRKITLTGAAVQVGVVFSVFGQIYQTGANAYDFFLAWTVFITLWVVISNFAPLWLMYIVLVNTTLCMYVLQVSHSWSELFVLTLLFLINTAFTVGFNQLKNKYSQLKIPNWFLYVLALAAITIATIAVAHAIFDPFELTWLLLFPGVALAYSVGLWFGYRSNQLFYLAAIPFSMILIVSCLLIKLSDDPGMFFAITLFIIGSVTLLIKTLISIKKRWSHEG